ncbi:hypothetical protein AA313_de0203149 [Arthrobotrys entomopaga]|nr:hypothetical protein AA313_de0203149 [Arthrobotrys entomopaga]
MDNQSSMTPPPKPPISRSPANVSFTFNSSPIRPAPPLHRRTSSRSGSTPQTPDRFIPSSASIQGFRINTPPSRRSVDDGRYPGGPRGRPRRRSASPSRRSHASRSRGLSAPRVGPAFGLFGNQRNHNTPITEGAGALHGGVIAERGIVVNAPMTIDDTVLQEETEMHEERLALALGVDLDAKIMSFESTPSPEKKIATGQSPMKGDSGVWNPNSPQMEAAAASLKRLLDAPGLRDDFYCTLLAYTPVSKVLAVALGGEIYGWSEKDGAKPFKPWASTQITAIAFSSVSGKQDILAVGRVDGVISLWGLGEALPRAEAQHQAAVACVSFKPFESKRRGLSNRRQLTKCEDLLLGDESGNIYFYAIEWDPEPGSSSCGMTLVRRMKVHTQQICGISWSTDATQVATGGNDNQCVLFDVETPKDSESDERDADQPNRELIIRHKWSHSAAVKAIAFCPWQKSLIATGGGSNDRGIHFFHTFTGSAIATINVSAQVTALIWSQERKEIAATFGYANPEHPIRIAVFTWPECHKVVSIPWGEDMRALYALPYPGGPPESKNGRRPDVENGGYNSLRGGGNNNSQANKRSSTRRGFDERRYEGSIVVAASDETIRFHEVWGRPGVNNKRKRESRGPLGSRILETLEGIEEEERGFGKYSIR